MSRTESPDSGSWGFVRKTPEGRFLPWKHCVSTSTSLQPLTTPFPPEMCARGWLGWEGGGPRGAARLEHLPADREPGHTILGATVFWSPCPRRGTGTVHSSVRHLDPASSALPQIGSPLPLVSAHNHGGFSSNEALRTRGGQAGFLGWQTSTVLIPRLLTKSQHPPGPAWGCPGKGKGPCGPRRGLAQAGASCHSPGGQGVALPDSHAAGQSPEGSAAPPAAGLGSGSGLRSSVARGAGVCAACRGRAIPSPSRRPCLQRQPELLPGRLPANHRGNPRGQGCSTMVTGEARGVIGGLWNLTMRCWRI